MKIAKLAPLALVTSAFLVGCGNDEDGTVIIDRDPPTLVPLADVRVVHASPDAPLVDVFAGAVPIASMQNLDYQQGTNYLGLAGGEYTFRVEAETPAGNAEVLSLTATLDGDMKYNVLAVGDVANLDTLVVTQPKADIPSGNLRVQVVHAAPDAPTVDVYVTAPDADLDAAQPTATLSFEDFTGALDIPEGSYQIRITAAGSKEPVFDSGSLALPAGADLFVAATQNVATGSSPVALSIADGDGSFVVLDDDTPAELRAIHGIADAPAVDVLAVVPDDDDIVLFDGPAFKAVSDYIEVAGGAYTIDVVADADNTVVAIDDAAVTLLDGVRYTALANNTLAMADLDLLVDNGRPLATAAQVRIIHASQAAGDVDIYVTEDGMIDMADPTFAAVPYQTGVLAETGYVQLAAGDYMVTVTGAGSKEAAIGPVMISIDAGGIYTAVAVDGDTEMMPPQLILADDFVD